MTPDALPRTIAGAAAALRSGDLTSVHLVEALQARADSVDPRLGAFTTQFRSEALDAAELADRELAAGHDRGPLHGIPVAVKDIIAAREGVTTASSKVVDATWWAGLDAPVVARLRDAGAVILGKTSTMEYALGEPDGDQGLAEPRCAWDLNRWAGGSSSGSGSGVAAGLFLGAVGTDTGGSVRLPAAFNGITGHKPTFGLVPKSGVHVLGFSLDAVGPLTRSVDDAALLLEAMAGHEPSDPYSALAPAKPFSSRLDPDALAGLRVGVDREAVRLRPGVDPAVLPAFDRAIETLVRSGAEIIEIETPPWQLAALTALVSWQVDALSYHRELLTRRWSEFGRGIRHQFIEGLLVTPSDAMAADRVRRLLIDQTQRAFAVADVLLSPTVGRGALPYDERSGSSVDETAFTSIWNLTGGPATSVPMGFTDNGLPLGLQFAGRPFDDHRVLSASAAFQTSTTHHLAVPPIAQEALA